MSATTRVSPFSCGSEKADWHFHNCDNCRKGYDRQAEKWRCDLERSLDDAFMGDGTIAGPIADRIGRGRFGIAARCGELEPLAETRSV